MTVVVLYAGGVTVVVLFASGVVEVIFAGDATVFILLDRIPSLHYIITRYIHTY